MERTGVCVVVLNYRGETVLLSCLQSVLAELGPHDHCLVIDHGQEEDLMRQVRERFPTVEVFVPEKNGGFAKGMNKGLQEAFSRSFTAAWLLNNDTVVCPGSLNELKAAHQQYPGAQVFSPLILSPDASVWFAGGRINFWRMRTEHVMVNPKETKPQMTTFLTGCALFVPFETYQVQGGFDERYFLYYEDAEYSLRTTQRGGKLFVVPQALVIHGEASNQYSPEKIYWLVRSGVEFFFRHTPSDKRWWFWGYFWIRRVYNVVRCHVSADPLAQAVKRAYTDASI